ncbi:hypothetical protein [Rhodoplanes roseus]|uniref:hypothetical protein n=1 Tax=Rhodoplanes roseus TaxID=29409 RepID=UPI0014760F7C|nr:hypothetical protein [Rhodoplanes roseus]
MSSNRHPSTTEPPTAVLAILDTFRRHPNAVSERALETLEAFGLIEPKDKTGSRSKHRA